MRIGILSQWYDPEPGPASVPGIVARALRDAGHEVVVLTGFPNYPSGALAPGYRQQPHLVEQLDGIEVHRVPLYPSHDRSAVGRVLNYVSFGLSAMVAALPVLGRVDAVWVYNSPITVGLPAAVLRVLGRVPVVLHVQDLWPDSVVASGLLPAGPVGRLAVRALVRCAAGTYLAASTVAVISPGMAGLLRDRGVPAKKLAWLPNCADEQLFRPVSYDAGLADEIGAQGRFTLMYGGSLGDVQGLDTAVRAAALLQDRPAFRLLLVGSGVAEPALRRLVAELGLSNVVFLGRRPAAEMPALMRVCDAQLVSLQDVPFLAATMPSKIQSVLASGRPLVVCAAGDPPELVVAAGAGVSSPPGDADALARTIRSLVDAPAGALEAMGARGLEYYRANLSADRLAERLGELCAGAAANGPNSRKSVAAGAQRSRVLATSAWFEPGYRGGGPIRSLARIVDTVGPEVDLTLLTNDRDLHDTSAYAGLSGQSVPRAGATVRYVNSASPSDWRQVWRELRTQRFDLLYVNSLFDPRFTLLPLLAARLGLVKVERVLIAPRGELAPGALTLKATKKRAFLRVARRVLRSPQVAWHASSALEAAQIRELCPAAEVITVEVQTSLPARAMRPPPASDAPVSMVFLSRISPKKNVDLVIRAMATMTFPATLDIWGPIEDSAYWERCIADIARLPSHITAVYRGEVPPAEVRSTFRNYDAFVFPTLGENFGHVIAESLSASCPVVCSDETPWSAVLNDAGGVVLSDLSSAALTAELDRLAAMTPAQRHVLRERAGAAYDEWRSASPEVNVIDEWVRRHAQAGPSSDDPSLDNSSLDNPSPAPLLVRSAP